jgi:16S rRNA C1402 (ribose-2'-O) methylase RsmI
VVRGTPAQLVERFQQGTRGEITLVISGKARTAAVAASDAELDERILTLLSSGSSARDAAHTLAAETGLRRQLLYQRVQALKARHCAQDE